MKNKYYLVKRNKGNVLVTILKNKSDNTYSFVNLTKGHICTCRFKTEEEAIQDLQSKVEAGEIIGYEVILEEIIDDLKEGGIIEDNERGHRAEEIIRSHMNVVENDERLIKKYVTNRQVVRDLYKKPLYMKGCCPKCGCKLKSCETDYCRACGQALI